MTTVTRIHAVAAIRWKRGLRNDPELLDLVGFALGDSITDITLQPDPTRIATNLYLVDVDLLQATATAINALISGSASANLFVLALETYTVDVDANGRQNDDTKVILSSNFDTQPTAGQLTTFGTELLARFPGLTAAQLQDAGQAILRAGLTRRQIIDNLAQRFARL